MQQWASRSAFHKFCLLVGACALLPLVLCGAEKSEAAYQELAQKAAKGDLSIDFRALRLACAQADHCDPAGDSKDVIAMRRAAQSNDFQEAVKMAEKLIAVGFPNIEAHAACAEGYQRLGQTDKASFHHDITAALIRSIMETGD
ncbi:MAG TPA: hypothetical protein VHA14_14695, partial [Bryobacteraceae bacterium]|nr:hypothetical protein [Bryobacteraceae bacterium]